MPHSFKLSPITVLAAAVGIGLAVCATVVWLAQHQPWLGIKLAPTADGRGAVVVSSEGPGSALPAGTVVLELSDSADSMVLEKLDLVVEPDGMMGDYGTYRRFLDRQERLAGIQHSEKVVFTDDRGRRYEVSPDQDGRPLTSQPPDFWVQIAVGLIAWLVSAAVFAFLPREASARYLLLSGAATLLFAPAGAVYTTRELAVPGTMLQWASDLNFLGGSLFAASFVALLLHYPRRLAPAWVGLGVVALYIAWFVMQQVGVFESMTFARRFLVMLGVLTTFALAAVHWYLTRRDPVARAALQWFLLSWMLGTCLFALFILLPQTFGVDTSPLQGYAFLLFLLVYGGLAFGILRYRLFELGEWWRRIVWWTLSVLLLISLDLMFLFGFHFHSGLSLALTLVICGVVWLPLRGWVWGWMRGKPALSHEDLFGRIIDVALAPPTHGGRCAGWQELLKATFDPLNMRADEDVPREVTIEQDGLMLRVPAVGDLPGQTMEFAGGGRRLFSKADDTLATGMVSMLSHAMESHAAYEKGVAEERSRIARDLHDNFGAQLLAALHSRDTERKDTTIRDALADLRDMINNQSAAAPSFDEALAELRMETSERLAATGVTLHWSSDADDSEGLGFLPVHTLRSMIREAVSNVIKHSLATKVSVKIALHGGWVSLQIADNGMGFDATVPASGNGLANMRARLEPLRGSLEIRHDQGGTLLAMRFPTPGKKSLK
ncbi:hypothetical protein HZ994_03625 [Akkermansiaceae bacterium]|nr:hypothetical protein HZ994_03625 [Akkermansiaceae bacterium]